jgi:hypothetical protein
MHHQILFNMSERLNVSAIAHIKQELKKANVRLETIGKACLFLMEKVEELSSNDRQRMMDIEADNDGSPLKKRKLNDRSISDTLNNIFESGSLVIGGIFNGDWVADRCDGHKRSAIFFRVLCKTIYPSKDLLLAEFLLGRCDVEEKTVRKWFSLNELQLLQKIRSRRSALTRFVKSSVIEAIGGTEAPPEKGDPGVTSRWIERGRELWAAAKLNARENDLLYPRCISEIVLKHASHSDSATEYSILSPPGNSQNDYSLHLVIIEAYFLSVISATFGVNTAGCVIPLKKETLCGQNEKHAIEIVLRQRLLIENLVEQ